MRYSVKYPLRAVRSKGHFTRNNFQNARLIGYFIISRNIRSFAIAYGDFGFVCRFADVEHRAAFPNNGGMPRN